ncbi:unnamed protein product [Leptidea sinapis]|uniref:Uncharacterized protein n=1 Tax=Leptidea sinapis TaxID=189913 RepID=A0A5E4PRY4_9NEOP|nr:unnamed protein product [Leptidea sinapis]
MSNGRKLCPVRNTHQKPKDRIHCAGVFQSPRQNCHVRRQCKRLHLEPAPLITTPHSPSCTRRTTSSAI